MKLSARPVAGQERIVPGNELHQARERLLTELEEGLKHGFFELAVVCELIKDRKRRLTITAGKSHQFIIPEEELQP